MGKQNKSFSAEVRERALRMAREHRDVYDSRWAAICSIAPKICCVAETLRRWVRREERNRGERAGMTSSERERLKALERENRKLKRANEMNRPGFSGDYFV